MEVPENKNVFLGIESIPHLGIYEKNDYKMMGKLFFHKIDGIPPHTCSFLPPNLKKALSNCKDHNFKSQSTVIQYFDGSTFKVNERLMKHTSCRLNYVLHPLIYAAKQTHYEEKIFATASLYTLDENEFGLIECKKENQHLSFNLDNIFDKSAAFEIHVHKDDKGNWLFSPNNGAFQIILSEPITTFIILNVFQDKEWNYHLILSWNFIVWEDKCEIVKGVLSVFLGAEEDEENIALFEDSLNTLLINTNEFVDKIVNFFQKSSDQPAKFLEEFSDFLSISFNYFEISTLFEAIYHFIQRKFRGTKVNNFGKDFFNSCSFELKKSFLASYFKCFVNHYLNSLCMQCVVLNLDCEMIVQQRKELFKRIDEKELSKHDYEERKPLHEMVTFILDGNFDLVNKIMKEKISKPLENYIYEQTWIYKGRIQGICNEFGRYSFLNDKKMNEIYHCSTEECCEIIMLVDNILETL